ncbi:heavy metal sensor histidine kinase [Nissabacter sp. SGAir0207]|uniref:heavy metal sensor histidine kinase n=1 Tax=Nissabacter sp. SGAir0207 TaxID=2126321 RepID=UPI0010CCCC01|nr:heavy metal sensor histidine kinase [Nissabacter sp. SGAir0207]QCR36631.1 two-component sensor histidine kinase [Nissabacter sp. SGAir0207]
MRRPVSLTLRSTLLFALVASLVLSAVGVWLYSEMAQQLARRSEYQVIGRVQYFRHLLADDFLLSQLRHNPGLFENMLGNEHDILRFKLHDGETLVDVNSARLVLPPVAALPASQPLTLAAAHASETPAGVPLRYVVAQVRLMDGRLLEITAAHVMTNEQHLLAAFRWSLVGAVAVAFLLIALLGYLVLRRGLRPLRRLAREVAAIHPASLSTRLDEAGMPRELHLMTGALNAMLARLAEGYQRLTQFSADLAHEIRTPVNALMGHCQVALYQPRSVAEYQTLLESNMEELERISRMVENILFLARASHAQALPTPAALSLAQEAQRICDYFEGLAAERDMTLQWRGAGEIRADGLMVQRALSNLVANAIRYGEAGEILLTIEPQAGGVALHVDNPGAPIPPAQQARLFDRFYRADAARSDGHANGLGLAIVRAIMDLHHGHVTTDCRQPGRVRFTLWFPSGEGLRIH